MFTKKLKLEDSYIIIKKKFKKFTKTHIKHK